LALAWVARAHLLLELGHTLEQTAFLIRQNLVFQQYIAKFAEVEATHSAEE
jgi:hypothetical protein